MTIITCLTTPFLNLDYTDKTVILRYRIENDDRRTGMIPIKITDFKRIAIVGCGGSGKSWLSKRIAENGDYKLTHLDNEFWKPNWARTPKDEWVEIQRKLILEEKWVIDGNYGSTMEIRFEVADLVIFLDINRLLCMWRAATRTGKKRSDLPDYLDEPSITNSEFIEFCKRIWNFRRTDGKIILELHDKYPEKAFLHIRKQRDVKQLLRKEEM